jgi:hypothetical protein
VHFAIEDATVIFQNEPEIGGEIAGAEIWSAAIRKRRSHPDCRAANVRLLPRQAGAAATWRNEPEIGTQEGRRHFWQNEPKAAVAAGARHASPLRATGEPTIWQNEPKEKITPIARINCMPSQAQLGTPVFAEQT